MNAYARTFEPTALSQKEAVTGTAGSITLTGIGDRGATALLLVKGTETVYITVDGTVATADNGFPLEPGAYLGVTMPTGKRDIGHIAAGAGSTLYAWAGVGA